MKIRKSRFSTAELLDLPEGMLQNYTIEIYSGKEMVLSGDFEITEWESTVLKLINHEHRIEIEGKDLMICDYEETGVRIRGIIDDIRFREENEQ